MNKQQYFSDTLRLLNQDNKEMMYPIIKLYRKLSMSPSRYVEVFNNLLKKYVITLKMHIAIFYFIG